MNKIRVLIKAPLLVSCGYGLHSREIFRALNNNPKYDVYCESINWGNCSFSSDNNAETKQIKNCVHKFLMAQQQKQENWDLFIHITVPNEFERKGKFNVGVTAGIETDRVSHVWIQKCNEMDLIVVPSEHSKKTIVNTAVDWQNPQTGEKGTFKLFKPIVVCPEGIDTRLFNEIKTSEKNIDDILSDAPDFLFLCAGQWGGGGFGEDRKNIANTIRYFAETFAGDMSVGLVLKVNMARNSVIDFDAVSRRVKEIKSNFPPNICPPIYLIHANLTDEEMAALYKHPKIKALVTLTHGEGWGRHLTEAAACDLPIIATNWSGHLDFLNLGKFISLDYEMKTVPEIAVWGDIIIKDSRWAEVIPDDFRAKLKKFASASSKPREWAKDLGKKIREKYNNKNISNIFINALELGMKNAQVSAQVNPLEHLQSFVDTPDDFNVLYTMPMSSGDVYISTAVIDGLKKELPEGAKIYFATKPQYNDILKGNPNIHKVIPWNETMINVDLLEEVFDVAFTPNTATQYTFSNWVRRGQGRLLAEEFANHCHCELGEYFIEKDESILNSFVSWDSVDGFPVFEVATKYMTFHPGSGKGQWEARKYIEWQEILNNLKDLYPDLKVVQVGDLDEPTFNGVDVDLRGKTNVHQLASVIAHANLHLSIDTFTMHLAAGHNVPLVALFGSSHAKSTGPWVKDKSKAKFILLESEQKLGCNKACYKYQCSKNKDMPCINEIDAAQVVEACASALDQKFGGKLKRKEGFKYKRTYGKISGYTTTYNALDYPFEESIKSMLGFCDEVVVVDGCSNDGTWEKLEEIAAQDDRVKLYQNDFDWSEPGIDGLQKAFARALCEHEYLWQMDVDEVVHENDYEKIKLITKRFPQQDILHLPIIELWGNENTVTGRRHCWKWRMSRNKPEITHGINKHARITNENTGRVYAKKGMSDGCEYVNTMTYEMLPHVGFYNEQIDMARIHMPERYIQGINDVFNQIPSVYHYSWCSIERKLNQLKKGGVWDKMWSLLYQEETQDRFPGMESQEQIKEVAERLFKQGGEDSDKVKYAFRLIRSNPAIMSNWLSKVPLIK